MYQGHSPNKGSLGNPPRINKDPNRPPDPGPFRRSNIPEHTKIVCSFCNQEAGGGNHSCVPFLLGEIAQLKMRIYKLENKPKF